MASRVSPRSSHVFEKFLSAATLSKIGELKQQTEATDSAITCPNEGLSEWLWKKTKYIADETLNTGYIQGIHKANLDPDDYVAYSVQDAVYCYDATKSLGIVKDKSNGLTQDFVAAKEKAYRGYTEYYFKMWYIDNPDGIRMGEAAQSYSEFEREVAEKLDPEYFIVSMIPCSRLWKWLADKIKDGETPTNVYSSWITENSESSGGKSLEIFVDTYPIALDKQEALKVYKRCMEGELKFFASATEPPTK